MERTEELGAKYDTTEIPDDLKDKAQEYHEKLVEAAAEADDDLMNKFFEDGDLSKEDIRAGVRKLTIAKEAFPIFCGSAFKDKGVQPMLDGVVDYLPSPEDVPAIKGYKPGDESVEIDRHPVKSDPFAALVFKISTHPFYGKLVFVRVYSGSVVPGDSVLDSTREKKERIGKIFQMHADKENPMDRADAGNIYTFVGLKNVTTGDTLCAIDDPITLDSMTFPDPVIQVAVEPKTKADQEKMGIALSKLAEEDPTFQVTTDEESGQTLIAGMGELQLDIIVDRMRREFKVECNQGKPQVAYRETIRKAVMDQGYTHKKQTGGSGQFAKVLMNFEPLDTTEGKTSSSRIRSPAATSPPNSSAPSRPVSRRPWSPVFSPASRSWASRPPSLTARCTRSIPPKWPSSSQVPCASRKLPRRPSRSFSNRS